ncbi:ABC transporter substrate-binding protein [Paramagnetospirillum magnetotacticum MS-1]|uniref:ABC transporter substrate-binding protein n=1 Tax=Paramagnetospirillum magnetotacticum MS-1 TaxID=272627 RepID=A0A0C2V2M7_PARME|nr:ABC transporter substrate-binding protein [Paramagnetospirillum magnetotacticum]KIL99336.1 ABC transporter substrate-binding protein [Paramagnetospirillum magnetotacticum MS-1]
MRRLATLCLILCALVWPGGAFAAETAKPFRIYMALWRGWEDAAQGFKDYFANQGIPVEMIIRDAGQDKAKLKEFVAEAKALKVDLVFTWGTTVSEEMLGRSDNVDPANHITDIPAVFAVVSQPVGGVVSSLASSERNITGTLYLVPMETQVNLIQSYRPLKRLGMIFNPLERNSQVAAEQLEGIGKASGFEVVALPLEVEGGKPSVASIAAKVAEIKAARVDFLYIPPDTFLNINRDILTQAALDHAIPTFAAAENPVVTSKAMFGGVYRYYTVGQLTAYKAEQILVRKIAPKDIPIDAPKRLSVLINMPVVRQIGLYPPMKLMGLAEIIERTEAKENKP